MFDTNEFPKPLRGEVRNGVIRRRRWTAEEKGKIVAEAIVPGAVIAEVARRHDLAPQHLSNWIRAAKDGRFALPACAKSMPCFGDGSPAVDEMAFVPVVAAAETIAEKVTPSETGAPIEIMIGSFMVRVPAGDARMLEAVMRAIKRALA